VRSRAAVRGLAILAVLALSAPAIAQPADSPAPAGADEIPTASTPAQPEPQAEAAPTASTAAISVTGRVINALGKPVAGAHVGVDDGTVETTTGPDGSFHIAAPIGATLMAASDGYDIALANVTGEVVDDIVVLTTQQETIEIRGERPPAAPGATVLDRSELTRIPGAGSDVVRAMTAMPGVVNMQLPVGYSGVAIRGSSPQDSKVMVDGFEVPVLFHDLGFRAVLPTETINSLDYVPGGFDVSFGRASSGIIDVTTRSGSAGHTSEAELSLLDGGLLAQGSIDAKTRYMFGLRRSTIDLLLPSLVPSTADLSLTTVPRYYDAQLRIDHELSASWRVALSALGSDDVVELFTSKDSDATAKRFYNRTRWFRTTASANYHDGAWSANLAVSAMPLEYDTQTGLYQRVTHQDVSVTPRAELTRSDAAVAGLTDVVWRTGAELQLKRTAANVAFGEEQREGEPRQPMDPKDTSTTFNGVIWMPDTAAWTTLSANVAPRIRVTAGVRADDYGRAREVVVQPRGEVQVKLSPTLTARLTEGMFSRPPEFQSEVLTKSLQSEHSTQSIAGLQYDPSPGLRLQTSVYYTDRSQLITRDADGTLGNDGTGTSTGAEFLGTYRSGGWFTWLSYSYSHSTRVDHPGMESRLFDFDQSHSLNAAASWKRGRWQLGGRFQLYSGLPFTPATGAVLDSDRNTYMATYGAVNSQRAPIHHELDVRVDYSWGWGPVAMTAFLDMENIYMNESVVTYNYNYDFSQRTGYKSLPILPSLGLRGVL
jgi:hypothetical protein